MLRSLSTVLALSLTACSLFLPAAWRSFRADPDDAVPAITRAFDKRQLQVADLDEGKRQVVSGWMSFSSGVDRTRERFVVSWNREESDGTLVIYVRHEAQDQEVGERTSWSSVYHDGKKETEMLDAITKELEAGQKAME